MALFNVIVALFALVVKEEVPVIVSAPLSDIFPVAAVAARLPPTVEAPRSKPDASTTVALPDDPVVFNATAPVNALALFNVIVPLLALVVKEEVPAIVSTPESVMLPVVAVATKLPPTAEAPKFKPDASTTVA